MPLLKAAFEEKGFFNVSTYINSGNVIFSSINTNISEISSQCKIMIEERFIVNVPLVIISVKELTEVLNPTPKWWDIKSDEEMNRSIT